MSGHSTDGDHRGEVNLVQGPLPDGDHSGEVCHLFRLQGPLLDDDYGGQVRLEFRALFQMMTTVAS